MSRMMALLLCMAALPACGRSDNDDPVFYDVPLLSETNRIIPDNGGYLLYIPPSLEGQEEAIFSKMAPEIQEWIKSRNLLFGYDEAMLRRLAHATRYIFYHGSTVPGDGRRVYVTFTWPEYLIELAIPDVEGTAFSVLQHQLDHLLFPGLVCTWGVEQGTVR